MERGHMSDSRLADAAALPLTADAGRQEFPSVKRETAEHLESFHRAVRHVGYVRLLAGQHVRGSRRALRGQQQGSQGGASREPAGLKLGRDELTLFCRAALSHTSPHVSRSEKNNSKKTSCQATAQKNGRLSKTYLKKKLMIFEPSGRTSTFGGVLMLRCYDRIG